MAALIGPSHTAEPEPEMEKATETETALFHRRIEFHVAKKPFNGFVNNNVNGFKLVTLNPQLGHLNNSGVGKKPERSDLLDNGLDSELGFEITFRRIGAGLRNLGNTCFLNSVLQCLTYTEPLAAYLQSGKHQSSCRTAGFCALCAIQKHVSRALQSTGRILEPKDLVSNLRCISRNFRNARQEDAHEYMVNLLETMHKCCLPSGVPSESPGAYDKSLVHKIFGGRLRSQVKCMQCSFCSNKFDPFLDLSLEIAKADSLDKALHNFTAKEMLDGGEKVYQCQQCKQKVKALKQLTVYKAPNVLAVHLKRFGSHIQGQKINKKVSFAPMMDLKPFVTGPYEGDLKYTLYGVLVHAGWSTRSGHYYCFVRTSSGMWYSLDDNQVVQVSEKRVLEQKAYMLFYFRDRNRSFAKKPSDVVQKENMVINAIGNAACSKPQPDLRGILPNGAAEKRLNGCFSVAASERNTQTSEIPAKMHMKTISSQNIKCKSGDDFLSLKSVSERNTQTSEMPEKAPMKTISSQNIQCKSGVDSLSLKVADPKLTSVPPKTKETLKEPVNVDSVAYKTGLSSNFEGARDDVNLGSDVKGSNPNNSSNVVQNLNNAASVVPSGCSEARDYLRNKESNSCPSGSEKGVDKSQSADKQVSTGSSVICASSRDMPKRDCENTQMTDDSPTKIGEPTTDGTRQNRATEIALQPMSALAGLSENTNQSLPEILRKQKPQLKVKKKPFKRPVVTASFSSGIIFGAALFQQKKNKRRKKCISLQKKSCNSKDQSGDDNILSNDGPSVAGESVPVSVSHFSDSQIMKESFVSDDKSRNLGEKRHTNAHTFLSGDNVNNEPGERIAHNSDLLSTETQPQVRQHAANGTACSVNHERGSRQADVMSFLTRGLEETTVAHWDDIGISTLEKFEMLAEGTTTQIGYVGDEWDEEYDRGKRKKIRGPKIDFGGPNLFQEFATNRKRAKVDKSRYVNKPFRI